MAKKNPFKADSSYEYNLKILVRLSELKVSLKEFETFLEEEKEKQIKKGHRFDYKMAYTDDDKPIPMFYYIAYSFNDFNEYFYLKFDIYERLIENAFSFSINLPD
mgnify:CR=1 FL=1